MPKRQRKILLSGLELITVLLNTTEPVKWRAENGHVYCGPDRQPICLPPAMAALIVKAGQYVGQTNATRQRVYYIRQLDKRVIVPVIEYWEGRACLRFVPDMRSIPEKVKRREALAHWDRMLKRIPKPRNWSAA